MKAELKPELEFTNMVGKVLLQSKLPLAGLTAVPDVGDAVTIESKLWEVAKRSFHYAKDGTLHKLSVQLRDNDY
jgi:hypothetical protein